MANDRNQMLISTLNLCSLPWFDLFFSWWSLPYAIFKEHIIRIKIRLDCFIMTLKCLLFFFLIFAVIFIFSEVLYDKIVLIWTLHILFFDWYLFLSLTGNISLRNWDARGKSSVAFCTLVEATLAAHKNKKPVYIMTEMAF